MEYQITHLGTNHFFDCKYFSGAYEHAEGSESSRKTIPPQHETVMSFTTQGSSKVDR